MSLDLVEIVTALDRDEDVHLARIIVLLKAFSQPDVPRSKGLPSWQSLISSFAIHRALKKR